MAQTVRIQVFEVRVSEAHHLKKWLTNSSTHVKDKA